MRGRRVGRLKNIFCFKHICYFSSPSLDHSSTVLHPLGDSPAGCICAVKGFAISSIPVVGDTVMTTVPRLTTSPSFLVLVVIFVESSGSGL